MKRRQLRMVVVAGAFVAAMLAARPALGGEPGYDVWFAGRILSVDVHRERVRIARGPTETAGRGIEECVMAADGLKRIRPGMMVEAQADTRRRPWRLLHLRVMHRKSQAPGAPATVALRI